MNFETNMLSEQLNTERWERMEKNARKSRHAKQFKRNRKQK